MSIPTTAGRLRGALKMLYQDIPEDIAVLPDNYPVMIDRFEALSETEYSIEYTIGCKT